MTRSILAALLVASPLPGQIGPVAVAPVSGRDLPDVVVVRPSGGRGVPATLIYRHGPDGWARMASLGPVRQVAPYEGFGGSVSAATNVVVVAAGDADGAWAGSVYRASDDGWTSADRVPVRPEDPPPPEGSGTLTLAGLMGIMQPPARRVAVAPAGHLLAAAVAGDSVVGVLRPAERGGWATAGALSVVDSVATLNVAGLAAGDRRIAVGLLSEDGSGRVRVFREEGGAWGLEAELMGPSAPMATLFGVAVAFDGDALLVGAPGTGSVHMYTRSDTGWVEHAVVGARDPAAAGLFGAALAVAGDELWIGAPGEDEGAGAVHRFERDGAGAWQAAGTLRGDGAGRAFGAAVAVKEGVAVVSAPAGAGRAAAYVRTDGGWSGPTWLGATKAPETVAGGAVRCREGEAAGFDCGDVDLEAFLSLETLGAGPGERVSDVWGWTDPGTGREYALVGITAGMAVVDITDPTAPVHVGLVPANPSGARDIKTYADHAFFTGDGAGDHGLVVFDLARVRDVPADSMPARLEPDARYTGIGSAHNLIMNARTGVAIPVGASGTGETCGGGLHMVDVTTPLEPAFLGCYTDDIGLIAPGRTHDGQCVVYHGPDVRFTDREICLASNETAIRIVDITDPDSVIEIAEASYPAQAYTHQGWLTDDHRYFFVNDELDELVGLTDRTRTLVWDVAELDDPVLVAEHLGPDGATDHNLYVRGDRMYLANYQAGMRVVDISDPLNPVEVGFFDTTPYEGNPPGFGTGAWTAYPFFASGTVVVTSMYEGVFVLRPRTVVP